MECWGKCEQNISPAWRMPFTSWQKFYVAIVPNAQKVRISWIDSEGVQKVSESSTLSVDFSEWHHWAFVYDGQQCRLYINGTLAVTANTNLPKPFGTNIDIGRLNSGAYYWDGIIDDFRISSRVRTDEEILAAYQSNSPLPVDKWTTYKLNFDGNLVAKTFLSSQWIEFPLGIFLLSSPTRKDENNSVYREVEAYDGLLILRDDKFDTRYTIQAGTNYRQAVIDILASAGINKHNIEQTDKVLPVDMEFEPGTEKLEAINTLLQAINYTPIHVDVYGYFTSMTYRSPSIRAAEYTYKDDELSIIFPGMEEELDLFNVPNKWVVVCSNAEQSLMSTYTNSNPNSPTSTVNRGRTIVDYREVTDIAGQQSLDAYVQRIAFEASQVYGKITFETAIMPHHDYMDVLQIEYSSLGIKGKYVETGWTMPLSAGARMKHEVRKVVSV
jgi:Concanavalin A-like lectin/glucanases superfamily